MSLSKHRSAFTKLHTREFRKAFPESVKQKQPLYPSRTIDYANHSHRAYCSAIELHAAAEVQDVHDIVLNPDHQSRAFPLLAGLQIAYEAGPTEIARLFNSDLPESDRVDSYDAIVRILDESTHLFQLLGTIPGQDQEACREASEKLTGLQTAIRKSAVAALEYAREMNGGTSMSPSSEETATNLLPSVERYLTIIDTSIEYQSTPRGYRHNLAAGLKASQPISPRGSEPGSEPQLKGDANPIRLARAPIQQPGQDR